MTRFVMLCLIALTDVRAVRNQTLRSGWSNRHPVAAKSAIH